MLVRTVTLQIQICKKGKKKLFLLALILGYEKNKMFFVFIICVVFSGHCPHDEWPEKVNSIIREWTRTIESSLQAVETI